MEGEKIVQRDPWFTGESDASEDGRDQLFRSLEERCGQCSEQWFTKVGVGTLSGVAIAFHWRHEKLGNGTPFWNLALCATTLERGAQVATHIFLGV